MITDKEIHIALCSNQTLKDHWSYLQAQAHACLDAPERQQLSKLDNSKQRRYQQQFAWSRLLLRRSLNAMPLEAPANQWRIERGKLGKPFFQHENLHSPFEFNISHSSELIALAMSHDPIGIDIEHTTRKNNTEQIAARYFSKPEQEQLNRLATAQRAEHFTRLWTLKEAYAKCLGVSLFDVIQSTQFEFLENGDIAFHIDTKSEQPTPSLQFFQAKPQAGSWLSVCWMKPSPEARASITLRRHKTIEQEEIVELPWLSSE